MQGGVGMASSVVTLAGRRRHRGGAGRGQLGRARRSTPRPGCRGCLIRICAVRRMPTALSWAAAVAPPEQADPPPMNTTIGVVATDAAADPRRGGHGSRSRRTTAWRGRSARRTCSSTATRCSAWRRAASRWSSRTPAFVRDPASRTAALNGLFAAAADTFAIACTDAVLTARDGRRPARLPRPLPDRLSPGDELRRLPAVEVFGDPAAMRAWSRARRAAGATIALVPTMGALHAGHLALIDEARRRATAVIVSIFVNPIQFDRAGDFDRYPRAIDDDLAACRAAGVDAVYAADGGRDVPARLPDPGGARCARRFARGRDAPGPLRGRHHRRHQAVRRRPCPTSRVFGQKDYQQLAIVRRMVADLDLGVEIVAVPTVARARRARPLEPQRSPRRSTIARRRS